MDTMHLQQHAPEPRAASGEDKDQRGYARIRPPSLSEHLCAGPQLTPEKSGNRTSSYEDGAGLVIAFMGTYRGLKCHCLSFGAAVPSDHADTGTMNSVMGSGAPLNWGFNITGEPDKSAPHALESVSGM